MAQNAVFRSATTFKVRDDQQLKNKLLLEANDIQYELYKFKLKSREIQAKIQSDVDSVMIISERFKSCTTDFDLLNALITLLIGLRESKRFVADMRNHYKDPSLINQNPKITPQKLKDFIDSLKYKTYDVKWFSVSLVSELAHLRLLRKTMAQTLSDGAAGSPVQAETCAPKRITAGTAGASLSRLLLARMQDMTASLSPATSESSDLPTSESSIPSASPPPTPAQSVSPNAGRSTPKLRVNKASTPERTLSKQLSEMNKMLTKLSLETSRSPSSDFPTDPAPSAATEPLTSPLSASQNASTQKQPAQGSAGQRAENEEISDMKVGPELVKRANDLQNELYRFKVKSREIAAKIQEDIDAVNSNIDFNLLDKEKAPKEWAVKHFLHSLLELKSKLSKAKADAVILRKKCELPTPMRVKPELCQMSRRLQTSFNKMLLSESLVRSDSKRERYLIETMARALSESNRKKEKKENIFVLYFLNSVNGFSSSAGFAASSPNSSLSKLLSELSIMLGKLSPPLSARAHAGQSSQNEDLSDMKVGPELVKQANDLQNELHRFKVKSSEIAAKIQKDVDAVNLNINVKSLDLLKIHRGWNIQYFLQCLHDLKSQLAKAKADVAILRNKQPSSPTSVKPDLNITSRQLKQSFYDMMQSESFVRSDSKRERHLIETMARALSDSNESVNGVSTSRTPESDLPKQTSRPPTPDHETQAKILAEKKLEAGEEFYKLSKYKEAVQMFSEACESSPTSSCYLVKRADALMMLGEHWRALADARTAVALEPTTCEAGYVIIAKCCFKLGDIEGSEEAVRGAIELFGEASVSEESRAVTQLRIQQEEVRNNIDLRLYQNALRTINTCLQLSPACHETRLLKAEILVNTNDYEESAEIANTIMSRLDVNERLLSGVYYILGLCSLHKGKNVEAMEWFQKIDKPNRYQKKAREFLDLAKRRATLQKKDEGNKAFEKSNYVGALNLYIEALDINIDDDDINATLHYNKATVFAKLNRTREAEQACTVALHLKQDYIKALERRAQCCSELGEYEDAVEDYTRLVKLYNRENLPDRKIRRLLRKAEKVLEEFKRVDYYYKILGVKYFALSKDIKNSYYEKFRYYHPDKHSDAGTAVIDRETRRAQRLTEAYNVIRDVSKRASYDLKQNRNFNFTTNYEESSSSEEDESPQRNSDNLKGFQIPLLRPLEKLRPFRF